MKPWDLIQGSSSDGAVVKPQSNHRWLDGVLNAIGFAARLAELYGCVSPTAAKSAVMIRELEKALGELNREV